MSIYKTAFVIVLVWALGTLLFSLLWHLIPSGAFRSALKSSATPTYMYVITANHTTLTNADLSFSIETSRPKNETNSRAAPDTQPLATVERSTVTSQSQKECVCNVTEYYPLSLDEFRSTFAQQNTSKLDFFDTEYIKDKYTIVIPSYKRDNAIPVLLNHFCQASHIHKILFVWQNIGRPVPGEFFNISCAVPYKFIFPEKNLLSNRFELYDEIETEGVFCLDDDSYLKYEILNAGFEAWKFRRHLMVGFVTRSHSTVNGHYHYFSSPDSPCYSIVLTGLMFLHRRYLELYSSPEVEKLRKLVDAQISGEDIIMNGIVSNYLNHAGIELTPTCHGILIQGGRVEIKIPGAGYAGLYRRRGHAARRDNCLRWIAEYYGELPLNCCHYEIKRPLE